MSTHNIAIGFCEEIRKISTSWLKKSNLSEATIFVFMTMYVVVKK